MSLELVTKGEPPHAGDLVICTWIPESRIPESHVRYVRKHVDRLRDENGLPQIKVRWFRQLHDPMVRVRLNGDVIEIIDSPGDFYGIVPHPDCYPAGVAPDDEPYTIALHAGLRGDEVPAIIAHEVRHLVQRRDGLPSDEADCDAYGREYLEAVG